MAKTRREFTPEFKREAVALLEGSGQPQMQIAAELGIQPSMLRQWRAMLAGASPAPQSAGRLGAAGKPGCLAIRPGGRDCPASSRA
jgi:transposase